MIHLAPNWRKLLKRAWSLRFMLLAGLFTGLEAIVPFFSDFMSSWLTRRQFAAVVFAVVVAAYVSRLVAQEGLTDEK